MRNRRGEPAPRRRRRLAALAAAVVAAQATIGATAEFYISATGNNAGNGAIDSPWATFDFAIGQLDAGDTLYVRGGTYSMSSAIAIGSSKSGTASDPYRLFAFPGETPVLDFRNQPYSGSNNGQKGISLNGSYWHLKGLTVQYAADNGVAIGGSYNVVEQVTARQNQDSGFQISGNAPSYNLLLNCDSYGNFDFGARGENADGFAVKFRGLGPGNVISGARAYNNADDGFDFWQAESGVTVVDSWAFNNGIASVFNDPASFAGDGNGIKLGHDSGTHRLENMLVFGNPANGVDVNGNATQLEGTPPTIAHGVTILNVTAADNGSRNFRFDENPMLASPPAAHILRNNISYDGSVTIDAGNTADHNTFSGPGGSPAGLGVTAADFISTADPVASNGSYHPAGTGGDRGGATAPIHASGPAVGPRQADGSLPLIDYLRLSAESHLVDAGVDVGLPYSGSAPDLGAFETSPAATYLPGDFDEDAEVDGDDLAAWQAGFGDSSSATHGAGDADLDGAVDGADFLAWQRDFGGSTAIAAGVPEPRSGGLAMAALFAAALVAGLTVGAKTPAASRERASL